MRNIFKQKPEEPVYAAKSIESGWKSIASTVAVLIAAPVLAIFITIFVFQSYEVFGQSMETTLQNGDRLIVEKLSKNWSSVRGKDYAPQRYQVVVFDKPSAVRNSGDVDHLIKRVIGLPGERVVVRDGNYTVYNQEYPEGFDPDEGQDYSRDILSTSGEVDITVRENEIFVSGDNRSNSLDSRNFGAIKTSSVTGIAILRFVPVGSFRSL